MNPALRDFPDEFQTPRLTIRTPRPGDGPAFNAAALDALEACRPWMLWAQRAPTVDEPEELMRQQHARFLTRENLMLLVFRREDGVLVASSGLHNIDWSIPRFEIGYWVRTSCSGRGYVTEAVAGITDFARDHLSARRVEIRVADSNLRSWRIPEKLGFTREGTLRQAQRDPADRLHDLRLYARTFP